MTHKTGSKDPLHGVTLETILNKLVAHYGWEELARLLPKIDCFVYEPSITSSLKLLRRVPWARKKVEELYLEMPIPTVVQKLANHRRQNPGIERS